MDDFFIRIGKSAFIASQQARWRAHGLWGQSKFVDKQSLPFIGIVRDFLNVTHS